MAHGLRQGLAQLLCRARMERDADYLKEGVQVLSYVAYTGR